MRDNELSLMTGAVGLSIPLYSCRMQSLVVDRMSSRAASPLEGVFRVHPAFAQVDGMGTEIDSTSDTVIGLGSKAVH